MRGAKITSSSQNIPENCTSLKKKTLFENSNPKNDNNDELGWGVTEKTPHRPIDTAFLICRKIFTQIFGFDGTVGIVGNVDSYIPLVLVMLVSYIDTHIDRYI